MKLLFSIVLLLLSICSYAQKEFNNWTIGNNNLIFDSENEKFHQINIPSVIGNFGRYSVSDKDGNIIFYGLAGLIYDKDGNIIFQSENNYFRANSFVALDPINHNRYYIFYSDLNSSTVHGNRLILSYNIVTYKDGIISVEEKKIKNITQKNGINSHYFLCIMPNNEFDKLWFITQENNKQFFTSYLISDGEIIREVESPYNENHIFTPTTFLSISPEFDRIFILQNRKIVSYGFDNISGILSDYIELPIDVKCNVFEFSPSGKYLFTALKTKENGINKISVFRYNASELLEGKILCKKIYEKEIPANWNDIAIADMKLSSNGNIYLLCGEDNRYISKIENCDSENPIFHFNALEVPKKFNGISIFPRFLRMSPNFLYQTEGCIGTNFYYRGYNYKSLKWDFGDGTISNDKNPKHTYQKDGTYKVKLDIVFLNGETKSLEKEITVRNTIRQPKLYEKD
ncbi:MAG: PKD domain-containing protein [Bacteroidales bacterium]|nr:PKD domain-containing protein [Bacteroidales bacterium]